MAKNNKYQDLEPDDLKGHFMLAEPHEEFIVGIDFCYCEVDYKGFEIVSCKNLGALIYGLEIDEEIATRNMPKHWEETFSIGELKGSFKIHSSDPSDVDAMRALFGESVGEVSYFDTVWQKFRDYWQDACETDVKSLDAKIISEHLEDDIFDTHFIKSIEEGAFEYFKSWPSDLSLSSLEDLPLGLAHAIAENEHSISIYGIKNITPEAAAALAKHRNELMLEGLEQITDPVAEAFLQHEGDLIFDASISLTGQSAEFLSKKKGTINGINPAEWIAQLKK
jgi:hypothetical protein